MRLSRVSLLLLLLLLLSFLSGRGDTTPQQLLCAASMSHFLSPLIYPSPELQSPSQRTSEPPVMFLFFTPALAFLSLPPSTTLSPSEVGDLSSDLKPSADAGLSSHDFHSAAAGARPPRVLTTSYPWRREYPREKSPPLISLSVMEACRECCGAYLGGADPINRSPLASPQRRLSSSHGVQ